MMSSTKKSPIMCWSIKKKRFYFWNLTLSLPRARYIAVNDKYDFLPRQLEDKGMVIVADIAKVLRDAKETMENGEKRQ